MEAMTFTKRPVVIQAIKWTGTNVDDVLRFIHSDDRWAIGLAAEGPGGVGIRHDPTLGTLDIPTLEGTMTASAGDWIIRGVQGEIYPCKPEIFRSTYETDEGRWCEGCGELVPYDQHARLSKGAAYTDEGDVLCASCASVELTRTRATMPRRTSRPIPRGPCSSTSRR